MKILIVEQNATMAAALRYILQHQLGMDDIDACSDGVEALRRLQEDTYGLVLLDWLLPKVSGIAVVEWMRGQPGYRKTPVIMVTMKDQPEELLVAVEAGVTDYALKPIDRDVLVRKIRKVLPQEEAGLH